MSQPASNPVPLFLRPQSAPAPLALTPSDAAFETELASVRYLEKTRSAEAMLPHWARLFEHHPQEPQAFRFLIRALERAGRHDAALALLEDAPDLAESPQDVQRAAECVAELRDRTQAKALFFRLLNKDPDNHRLMTVFGKYLKTHGDLRTAEAILSEIPKERRSPTSAALIEDVGRAIEGLERIAPGVTHKMPAPGPVLAAAISIYKDRAPAQTEPGALGGVALYTGSLGAGGAERQLTRIAAALHARAGAGGQIGAKRIAGPVEVLINAAEPGRQKDFFLPDLEAAGIPVTIVRDMPRTRTDALSGIPATLRDVLPSLSAHPRFGLEHLVAHLRRSAPEVLYIWQDGAVLTGALAALIAGVPKIAISLRGLPPNLRPHMMKPEYRDMYRALAPIPGVNLSCNSAAAAEAYAEWLGIPGQSFSVLYNASLPLPTDAEADERALWRGFAKATPGAGRTIGGIFRFNENKRWDLWVAAAAERLKRHPQDRFVLIGDGEDRAAAEAAAQSAGIAPRMLFVGHSKRVGFWLSKLDAVLHLARHEGLPNVLIEAQMAGVPVVATPAGGSAETFANGLSGILLPSAEAPQLEDILASFETLFATPNTHRKMAGAARRIAEQRFDLEKVLERSIAFFDGEAVGRTGTGVEEMPEENNREKRSAA